MLEALLMPLQWLLSGIAMIGAVVWTKVSPPKGPGGAYAIVPVLLAPIVVRELFARITHRGALA
jgi:hypothetical protein